MRQRSPPDRAGAAALSSSELREAVPCRRRSASAGRVRAARLENLRLAYQPKPPSEAKQIVEHIAEELGKLKDAYADYSDGPPARGGRAPFTPPITTILCGAFAWARRARDDLKRRCPCRPPPGRDRARRALREARRAERGAAGASLYYCKLLLGNHFLL